jgi:hypothetical protein
MMVWAPASLAGGLRSAGPITEGGAIAISPAQLSYLFVRDRLAQSIPADDLDINALL